MKKPKYFLRIEVAYQKHNVLFLNERCSGYSGGNKTFEE